MNLSRRARFNILLQIGYFWAFKTALSLLARWSFLSYLIFDRLLLLSFLFSGWWRLACRLLSSCNLQLSTDPIRAAFDACWARTSVFSVQEPSTYWRKASYCFTRGSTSQHNLYFYSTLFNVLTGTSNRTRTCGPLLRRQLLFPTELLRRTLIDERLISFHR